MIYCNNRMPQPFFCYTRMLLVFSLLFIGIKGKSDFKSNHPVNQFNVISDYRNLYDQLLLSNLGLKRIVFDKAISGWTLLNKQKQFLRSSLLTIIDFSQSSNNKRLYIIDVEKATVVFNTYVAHGRNSGNEYAVSFANKLNSFKSSLGFYTTAEIYNGNHGLSMRLKGLEKGINDGAESRGIVMHGAAYVSTSFIKNCGRLGRSQGCPAVPEELCQPIINYIKDGSCVYMYYPDTNYCKLSSFG